MDVYVPTMKRPDNVAAIIPRWSTLLDPGSMLNLVVARDEAAATDAIVDESPWRAGVRVVALPKSVQGIGAIRAYCVELSYYNDHATSMIMSDDDIYPHHSANLFHMLRLATNPTILGVGCVTSYHSLLLGHRKYMLDETIPILATSGYGFRMFAINTKQAMRVGNFNRELDVCYEDAEFMRQGVARGLRWYLDPLVKAVPLGKRFDKGGIAALTRSPEERARRTAENYETCYANWHKYMAEPPKNRMSWKKMLDDYWPGWREASE